MPMTDCNSYCELAENCTNSKVKIHQVSHIWIIDHFDFCEARGDAIKSPLFAASTNGKAKWYVMLKPNGETDRKDTIGLYLHLSDSSQHGSVFARYFLSIFNEDQKEEVSVGSPLVHEFIAGGNGWGRKEFLKKDGIFRRKLLSNNVLKVSCDVAFSQDSDVFIQHHHCHSTMSLSSAIPDCDVTENLGMLLKSHFLSDVVISVKGKEYPAHKIILAARSKVFAAMFSHNTTESKHNRVDITDLKEEVVGEMLRYIYTGKCENLGSLAEDLLAAADKYDLDRLKMISAEALFKSLSVENAANILILAEMYRVNLLKSETIKFIVSRFDRVMNTEGWKHVLPNSQLTNDVCLALLRH